MMHHAQTTDGVGIDKKLIAFIFQGRAQSTTSL